MHTHCLALFARRGGACPTCQADWAGENKAKLFPVGEDAARDGNEQRQTRAAAEDEAEADEDEADGDGDEEPADLQPTQPAKKTAKRSGGRRARIVDDEDDDEAEDSEGGSGGSPAPTQRATRSRRR
jgi:hypothetical protein